MPSPAPPQSSSPSDPLISDVRREITEIVREVAQAVHEDRSESQFLAFVADRVLRAMAAEGVVVWRRTTRSRNSHPFTAVVGLGRVTEPSTPVLSGAAHQRLITEVTHEQQPVVVPPSPGAVDDSVPVNPTEVPVAVVPIESDPTSPQWSHVLEIFLEPDCGVATQRGYLRFAAQMADLTGEFLRLNRFRQMRMQQELAAAVDDAVGQLHEADKPAQVESIAVDAIADIFAIDRVALCIRESDRVRLVAVSHVETIDQRSPAADEIRRAAMTDLNGQSVLNLPVDASESDGDDLVIRAVAAPDASSPIRFVLQCRSGNQVDLESAERELHRIVHHTGLARRQVDRHARLPGGRILSAVQPSSAPGWSRWRRPIGVTASAALLVIAAMFPLPMVIVTGATIRPAEVQTLTAPRDVTVRQVHVEHGQFVRKGDVLLTLTDVDLEQEMVTLAGKRAVLTQQQSRWTNAIVAAESTFADDNDQLQSEQRLVDEEIRSIDQQLSLLRRIEESLVVRADRDGVVDAWRIEDRLKHRPLRRGDHLLQVVGKDSPWFVDADVPQNRMIHLESAMGDDLESSVSLLSRPEESCPAALVRIGPAAHDQPDGQPLTMVVLKLEHDSLDTATTFRDANTQSGAPARVDFHCGRAPAAYLLFQDVIRTAKSAFSIYVSGGTGGNSSVQGDQPS